MPVQDPHDIGDAGWEAPFVGRDRELARLRAELDRVRAGESRLVSIDGPAGMGKTTLLRRFLANAHVAQAHVTQAHITKAHVTKAHITKAQDVRALYASGEDSETLLPYGIVAQLAPQVVPQVAGAREEEAGRPDPLVVGSALVDHLQGLQDDRPLAVLVDDAHWADAPSLSALAFAVRRLRAARVLTVVITTDAADPRLPGELRRMLADDETARLSLSGLGTSELRELSGRPGERAPLARRAAARLREHTDGNPRHARALLERVPAEVLDDLYAPLPVPRAYESLARERLADCAPEARLLIEAASVLGRSCTLHEAATLCEVQDPLYAAEQAVATGLLTERPTAGGLDLRFPHPLVQAAVYQRLGPAQRTRLHLRAAEVLSDDPARLRHRLRAAGEPDEPLAAEFARLARRDAARGLWAEAAEHMTWAARLSTGGGERAGRTAEAVEALLFDGQVAEAGTLADGMAEDADPAPRGYVLGAIAAASGSPHRAEAWLTGAWRSCDRPAEPALAGRVAEQLAFSLFLQGRCADGAVWAERAAALASHRPGADLVRALRLLGLAATGRLDEGLGHTARPADAAALATTGEVDALLGRGLLLVHSGDVERAVAELTALVEVPAPRSVQFRLVALAALAWAEFQLGGWDDAAAHAAAAVSATLEADQRWFAPMAHGLAALVPAARGEWGAAEAHVQAAAKAAGPTRGFGALAAAAARAHLALARGDRPIPSAALWPLTGQDPPWHEYVVEVLLADGRLAQARDALARYEKSAAVRGGPSVLASVARLRGNLLAAQDEGVAAEAAYQSGLRRAGRTSAPFVQARLELDYGRFLRRTGRRAVAAEHLESSRGLFERLGARPYVQRCDKELGRRAHWPMQMTAGHAARLTPQEQAVARLVATGLTNRQVAGELVLSVKTIEYHLSNAYSKLGVAGRSGLAAMLAEHSALGTQTTPGFAPGVPGERKPWDIQGSSP
ncbi:BREX system ATP-binding domain-containing protein [Spirillospora sp. NPDC047279]|uniref:helix-turn-helix transcriptional regulator n=1 Tax=Spirillospora sp. NPDC047279 TaxID=3155478 RepID=UPI0033C7BEC7